VVFVFSPLAVLLKQLNEFLYDQNKPEYLTQQEHLYFYFLEPVSLGLAILYLLYSETCLN
jgi:hypothetical protein